MTICHFWYLADGKLAKQLRKYEEKKEEKNISQSNNICIYMYLGKEKIIRMIESKSE